MKLYLIPALALALATTANPRAVEAMSTTVNCSQGQKITTALNAGFDDIKVRGICTERVEIRVDDVAIEGKPGAKVIGQLFVNGARRVTIKNLAVEGTAPTPSGAGILLDRGAAAVLDHVTVRNAEIGVDANGNSYVEVLNGSLFENNIGEGIRVQLGTGALVKDSTSRNNGDNGVAAYRGGHLELVHNSSVDNASFQVFAGENSNVVLTDNTLTGNGENGALGLFRGSVARLRGGNTLTTSVDSFSSIHIDLASTLAQYPGHDTVNGRLFVHDSSSAEFRDVEINANIDLDVSNDSILILTERPAGSANTTLNGGVGISGDSALFIDDQVSITGAVFCADAESSFAPPDPSVVAGGIDCTGF